MNAAAQAAAPTRPQMLVAAAFAAACLPRLIDPGQSPGQRWTARLRALSARLAATVIVSARFKVTPLRLKPGPILAGG